MMLLMLLLQLRIGLVVTIGEFREHTQVLPYSGLCQRVKYSQDSSHSSFSQDEDWICCEDSEVFCVVVGDGGERHKSCERHKTAFAK